MTALVVLQSVVLVVLVVLVSGLLRSHATILRRLHELGVGTDPQPNRPPRPPSQLPGPTAGRPASLPGHDVSGLGLDDGAVAVRVVDVDHDTILVFLSSGCSTCGGFWEALGHPDLALPEGTRLVIVTQGPDREHVSLVAELAPAHLPLVLSSAAWHDYAVPGSPYVVLVDGPSGRVVGEGTAPSFEQVLSMLGRAGDDAAHRSRLASHRGDKAKADAEREAEIDDALIVAGVRPGDPSLYRSVDQPSASDDGPPP
ncbi:MAG: hypothetical protein AVDCRST_MAG76-895 [uncultured Acidimicrobiales bacterium]|uniref:Thioredoxin domain-containing protein n=1 Tax=uncultured Acidimicrobiales bacterium TaxID=310071 RepID=A0A6J4HHH1_9ACTN|nr:MAG: hypothetical protein AVDCRST_MAG76-895 [uncultured Acidimicrobiales bacterium]